MGDEAEQGSGNHEDDVDQKDGTTTLPVNCISYALSTQAIEDHSSTFFSREDKDTCDTTREDLSAKTTLIMV